MAKSRAICCLFAIKFSSLEDDNFEKTEGKFDRMSLTLNSFKEAGIPAEKLNIGKGDVLKIRAFLSMASDDDIARLISQFGGKKQ